MPYASNALDGSRVYFEDDGGGGSAVLLHEGLLVEEADHYAAHTSEDEVMLDAVLRSLRAGDSSG